MIIISISIVIAFLLLLIVVFIKPFIERRIIKKDPFYSCELFKETGCSRIDSYLCNYPKCNMLNEYKTTKKATGA